MRAFHVLARERGQVVDVAEPVAGAGQAVVESRRVGVCGTDLSLYSGDEQRIARARTTYPLQLGHEWAGEVVAVAPDVDPSWIGRRVVGDAMIGCGHCDRCNAGQPHLCEDRIEVGVRGGWPGAIAERFVMPVANLLPIPDALGWDAAALVEPGANAARTVRAADVVQGDRVLVIGPGSIGILCALFARAVGAEVQLLGRRPSSIAFAAGLGIAAVTREELPASDWDAVIDASSGDDMPALALDLVRPGGRVALVGVSATPSTFDSRVIVHRELTVRGILGGSDGLQETIDAYTTGAVDPLPLVGRVVGMDELDGLLGAGMPPSKSGAPKTLVDPARLGDSHTS